MGVSVGRAGWEQSTSSSSVALHLTQDCQVLLEGPPHGG